MLRIAIQNVEEERIIPCVYVWFLRCVEVEFSVQEPYAAATLLLFGFIMKNCGTMHTDARRDVMQTQRNADVSVLSSPQPI